MMRRLFAAVLFLSFAGLSMAQDPAAPAVEDELGWSGSGELGLVRTSGNTDSEAFNTSLEFIKTTETWKHRFFGSALLTSEDGNTKNERYIAEAQSNRNLSDISWLFGSFRWDADKFGSYDPQMSLTAGYGRELMKSETHVLKAEAGAGYRWLEERVSGETSDGAIARFVVDDWWKITDNTEWSNRLLVETGSDNTFTQFNTGLAVAMNAHFAVKLGYEIRHNSELPPGTADDTDTVLTANLVYNF